MISNTIPLEKRIERLQFENPWWVGDQIQDVYQKMSKRLYFDVFFPFVTDVDMKRAVVLMGPRRVGKTVMMHHAIQELIDQKVSATQIIFVGIDNPIYMHLGLEDLLEISLKALGKKEAKGMFVFFDEIQYLKDWERHLKVLVDRYPYTKFIVSGSAAAALKLQSTESGAGRFTEFMLPPLTFQEYIHLRGLHQLMHPSTIVYHGKQVNYRSTHDIRTLNEAFFHYLNFGGYPEVVLSERIQSDPGRYIKSDIVDKVLLRDLPSLYGIRDVQELNSFFGYLAYNSGKEFSFENLCRDSGIKKEIIKKYLDYLSAAFLIKVVHKVDVHARKMQRVTTFKVYLTNPSLRTAMFSPVREADDEAGNLVETAIFSQWLHREKLNLKYASWRQGRSSGEVDVVLVDTKFFKPSRCVEVKWSNRYFSHPKELVSLSYFCEQNNLSAALVTSIDKEGVVKIGGLQLTFLPAAVYAYNIGSVRFEADELGAEIL